MTDIAEGRLSIAKGHRYAQLAAQKCDDPATQALAALGSNGKHLQNLERDFHSSVMGGEGGVRLQPMHMHITVQAHLADGPKLVQQPFFAPHEILHMWYCLSLIHI